MPQVTKRPIPILRTKLFPDVEHFPQPVHITPIFIPARGFPFDTFRERVVTMGLVVKGFCAAMVGASLGLILFSITMIASGEAIAFANLTARPASLARIAAPFWIPGAVALIGLVAIFARAR